MLRVTPAKSLYRPFWLSACHSSRRGRMSACIKCIVHIEPSKIKTCHLRGRRPDCSAPVGTHQQRYVEYTDRGRCFVSDAPIHTTRNHQHQPRTQTNSTIHESIKRKRARDTQYHNIVCYADFRGAGVYRGDVWRLAGNCKIGSGRQCSEISTCSSLSCWLRVSSGYQSKC